MLATWVKTLYIIWTSRKRLTTLRDWFTGWKFSTVLNLPGTTTSLTATSPKAVIWVMCCLKRCEMENQKTRRNIKCECRMPKCACATNNEKTTPYSFCDETGVLRCDDFYSFKPWQHCVKRNVKTICCKLVPSFFCQLCHPRKKTHIHADLRERGYPTCWLGSWPKPETAHLKRRHATTHSVKQEHCSMQVVMHVFYDMARKQWPNRWESAHEYVIESNWK